MPVGLEGRMMAAKIFHTWKTATNRLDQRVRWEATSRWKYLGGAVCSASRSPAPMKKKKKGRAVAGDVASVVQRHPSRISVAVPVERKDGTASRKIGGGRTGVTEKRDGDDAKTASYRRTS